MIGLLLAIRLMIWRVQYVLKWKMWKCFPSSSYDSTDNLKINLWWSLVFAKVLDSFVYYIAWFSKALGWTSVVIRHPMFYWKMSCTFNDLKLYSWVARTLSWSFLLIGVPMFLPSYSVRTSEKPLKILRVFLLKTNVFVLF